MTKSKNSIVTTSTTYLDKVTFPVIVIESTFSLLLLDRYLLPLTTLNRYLSSHSKNFIFTTLSENATITRHGVFLVTIPVFVLCHDSLNSVNSAKVILGKIQMADPGFPSHRGINLTGGAQTSYFGHFS